MKFIKNIKALRPIIRKLKIGSFEFRLSINALKRMQYAYICFHAAKLGKKLGYKKGSFPIAEKLAKNVLAIPHHQNLSKKQILYVCDKINSFYS